MKLAPSTREEVRLWSVYRALCGVWRRMAGKLSDRAPPSAPPTGDRAR